MRLYSETLRLAVPAILENLFISAVFLVDSIMVAQLGSAPLAAVGLAGVVMWRLVSMGSCLRIGLGAATARRWGEGNVQMARALLSHGLVLGGIVGFLCILLYPLAGIVFAKMNAEGRVLEEVVPYFRIILVFLPFRLAALNLGSSIRAAGNTKTPMLITIASNILNVIMNYVLIFGHFGFPALGTFGAGLATGISFFLEFLFLFIISLIGAPAKRVFAPGAAVRSAVDDEGHLADVYTDVPENTPKTDSIKFSMEGFRVFLGTPTKRILGVSYPVFFEEVAITFGFVMFVGMIASFGELVLAAHTAIIRIESFSFLAGFGISIAAATLVGQALGAGSVDQARRSFASCLVLSTVFMGGAGIAMCLFPELFLSPFFTGEEASRAMDIAIPLLLLVAIEQPFIGSAQILANGLRGAGETKTPFMAQFCGVTFIRVGLGYLMAFPWGMGMEGLYWATVIDWIVRTVLLTYLVKYGAWEKREV